MSAEAARITENLARVQERMAQACARAGRAITDVRLVAVTKTVDLPAVETLYEAGVRDFGENRVDEAIRKAAGIAHNELRWHFIGHLQRNKAAKVARLTTLIHSVESVKLVAVLEKDAAVRATTTPVLLEVNISGEENKYGVPAVEAVTLARQIHAAGHLELRGLMAMAPFEAEPEATRPVFAGLRDCRDRLEQELGVKLPELSMGMTNDFEIAIEEGATLVRIGSALFA